MHIARTPEQLREKILSRCVIDPDTGCWVWQGGKSKGYGIMGASAALGRSPILVHRAMYIVTVGEANGSLHHKCANPPCCNPDHLELMSQGDHLRLHRPQSERCHKGHEPNWRVEKSGNRACRECDRERKKAIRLDPVKGDRLRLRSKLQKRRARRLASGWEE